MQFVQPDMLNTFGAANNGQASQRQSWARWLELTV